ncbi:cytochrome [Zafaria sp. Z1313]|uniref:cytochrome n=1 Tax=unclassified Zafaria TaxID=2828765 RepID=UPI002E7A8798|nr:cytochrome [Zafaria sp. J156]MEE1620138.1 cytochrome [Zafaria sp. J156]
MTTPALAQQTDYGRMYARRIGGLPEVPSITTVISQQGAGLDGWIGHMAATAAVGDGRLAGALGKPAQLKAIARDASKAAEVFRNAAAARGDRVHAYCEQVALRALGRPHTAADARALLEEHGEGAFASRFDDWWDAYQVVPLAAEVTVWNHTVGYAGTLDLVARIGGRLCLVDYKTKGTGRDGRVKPLDAKVVMQLVAGLKAEEMVVDAAEGTWEEWKYGEDPLLLGVAVGETEVQPMMASPQVLPAHWSKFWALRAVWENTMKADDAGTALRPIGPPPPVREAAVAGP